MAAPVTMLPTCFAPPAAQGMSVLAQHGDGSLEYNAHNL